MINRRHFLRSIGQLSLLTFLPAEIQWLLAEDQPGYTIEAVDILRLSGTIEQLRGVNRQYQAQPLHLYPEHRPDIYRNDPNPQKRSNRIVHHYLRIRSKNGTEGLYGYIDPECVRPVLKQLKTLLIGQNAMAVEQVWDKMYRHNRHSRAGHYMMGLSAVDNALWDWRGRQLGMPVYQLLGGQTRETVPVYGSCLGYSIERGKAGPQAKALAEAGFSHQKWFLAYGPGQGQEGMQKNIALVKELREGAGEAVQIMFDAFMAWDLPYATQWAKAVEQYHPAWIEEAFPTNRLESFIRLAEKTSIPVATGEHFYNRWEVLNFLKAKAIQIVQADPEWCGGVSELIKICHLASSFGAKVFPHGHNLHAAMHVVASQSPEVCPRVEYLINHVAYKMHFQQSPPLTDNGHLKMPATAGFGIELDRDKVEQEEVLS